MENIPVKRTFKKKTTVACFTFKHVVYVLFLQSFCVVAIQNEAAKVLATSLSNGT